MPPSCRSRGSRSPAPKAFMPPSTGRPPRPEAPPACAPPSSSTLSRDSDHDPPEPAEPARMAGPAPRPARPGGASDHRADGLGARRPLHRRPVGGIKPGGHGAGHGQGRRPPRGAGLGGGRRRGRQPRSRPPGRDRRPPGNLAGLRGIPGAIRRPRPDAGSGKKRPRTLADWIFGGGDGYARPAQTPAPTVPQD